MKNVILFQPRIGDLDTMRTKPTLPLALLHCASIVSKDYQVKIIDQRVNNDWKGMLDEGLLENTVCVGITSLTGKTIKEGLKFSKYIKQKYRLPVVWGGVHVSLLPEQTLQNENIDVVVEGEGEITFNKLVKAFDKNTDLSEIDGIWIKKNGKPVKTSSSDFIDLNKVPDIPYHLVNLDNYVPEYMDKRTLCFQSSRGCHLQCSYCYNNVFNRGCWRSLSAENTINRIRQVISKNKFIKAVYFIDDNFFVDLERAREIIKGIKEMKLSWLVQGVDILSLKNMDDSFFELLNNSNCLKLSIGIESGSKKIRKLMNKEGTNQDIIDVVERLKKYNIIFYVCFIVGVPTETVDDIKKSIELLLYLHKINPNIRNSPFYIYTPYPGTPMFKKIYEDGYKMPEQLEDLAECEWDKVTYSGNNKLLCSIAMVSMFLDKKAKDYNAPYVLRFLVDIYRPLAWYRMKNFYFKFMFEEWCYRILKSTWYKIRSLMR